MFNLMSREGEEVRVGMKKQKLEEVDERERSSLNMGTLRRNFTARMVHLETT